MAKLVFASGVSWPPIFNLAPEDWAHYLVSDTKRTAFGWADGSSGTYADLEARNGHRFAAEVTLERFTAQHAAIQALLDRIASDLAEAKPDVVVAIANDHGALFDKAFMPPLAIYRAARLSNAAHARHDAAVIPEIDRRWQADLLAAHGLQPERNYPGEPAFADALIGGLNGRGVDAAAADAPTDPSKLGLTNSVAFAINRLFGGRVIPTVPVLVNTNAPPAISTLPRCLQIGRTLRQAIEAAPGEARVAILALGNLSHIAPNEALDEKIFTPLRELDLGALAALPQDELLRCGAGQMMNWILMAGALEGLKTQWAEYRQVTRTSVGTGVGVGFAVWR